MGKPIVAIVGRPNVGKSTLFNKLVGQRLAIVEDTPGVTRDRLYGNCEWQDHRFLLIDTGGIEPKADDVLLRHMRGQAQLAIDTADAILFVTDIRSGVTAQDQDIAAMLMRSGKPVFLVVNKVDGVGEPPMELYDFYSLGIGEPYPVSSVHGHGTGDLLEAVCACLPENEDGEDEDERIGVAVIGRPNVGKSSLVNHILGEERMIVANEAGTTRDAVDSDVDNRYGKFTFIDTAGLRKRGKVEDGVERYSVLRSLAAVERAKVCVIMIDATEGFTEQDSKVAGFAHEQGKACIIAVNKWDAVEKDDKTMDVQRKKLMNDFSFMSYAPIIFISAKTGQRVDRLFELIKFVDSQNAMRVTTGMLNDLLARATARVQPPSDKGKRLKIYYMTQIATRPPTFVCFCNSKQLFHFSYARYIENQIRETFGLEGTPVRIVIRERGEMVLLPVLGRKSVPRGTPEQRRRAVCPALNTGGITDAANRAVRRGMCCRRVSAWLSELFHHRDKAFVSQGHPHLRLRQRGYDQCAAHLWKRRGGAHHCGRYRKRYPGGAAGEMGVRCVYGGRPYLRCLYRGVLCGSGACVPGIFRLQGRQGCVCGHGHDHCHQAGAYFAFVGGVFYRVPVQQNGFSGKHLLRGGVSRRYISVLSFCGWARRRAYHLLRGGHRRIGYMAAPEQYPAH